MIFDINLSWYIFKFFPDVCRKLEMGQYRELALQVLTDLIETENLNEKLKQYMFKPFKFMMFERDAH